MLSIVYGTVIAHADFHISFTLYSSQNVTGNGSSGKLLTAFFKFLTRLIGINV